MAQAGATTVSAHIFYDIVRKLADGAQVSLEIAPDTGQLLLRSGRSRFHLQALPASDFPDLTAGEFAHKFDLPAIEFAADRQRAIRDLDRGDALLSQRHLFPHRRVDGKTMLRAVATDGHRLARIETPAPAGRRGMPGVIAPRKAVGEILKLLEDPASDVTIEITVKARFRFGDVTLTTKLIDGTFPDYNRVIPPPTTSG